MTSHLLSQLGGVLVQSLWQGAMFGVVLMVLLVFFRQARWRYALACLTLFAMFIWFAVSAVSVLKPARDFTLSTNSVVENVNAPTSELLTDSAVTASNQTTGVPTKTPALNQTNVTRATPTRETRALLPHFNLQDFLPYISLLWMMGVAVLSIRLLLSVYLLKRYRKESFELSEPWIHERLQLLAQRMKLAQRIKLLQTTTLTTPAVMGVVKPLLLLPSSLVSGLSIGQLDLLLAHELAHIKRRDYLVNILQTLAETLLFYHPVVWWVSKVIRQEREHCCDDMTLQVTGQSALEYAEVLLRLEKSRQGLVLAASNGSLLRRVERLLNPSKAGVSVGSSLATLLLVVCLSLTFVVNAVDAQPIQVSKVPYVFSASIAVDPTNSGRIAITVNSTEVYNCDEPCKNYPLLYTSSDAGQTWHEQIPYGKEAQNRGVSPLRREGEKRGNEVGQRNRA
jgi:beta-lactamase regulating signal transducer with metallopeptidase domain